MFPRIQGLLIKSSSSHHRTSFLSSSTSFVGGRRRRRTSTENARNDEENISSIGVDNNLMQQRKVPVQFSFNEQATPLPDLQVNNITSKASFNKEKLKRRLGIPEPERHPLPWESKKKPLSKDSDNEVEKEEAMNLIAPLEIKSKSNSSATPRTSKWKSVRTVEEALEVCRSSSSSSSSTNTSTSNDNSKVYLDMDGLKLSSEQIRGLLPFPSNLYGLRLGANFLHVKGAQYLGEALSLNPNLEVLYCGMCELGPKGTEHILNGISSCSQESKLRALFMGSNRITSQGVPSIVSFLLNKSTKLEKLNIGANELGGDGASIFAEALVKNSTLQQLQLSGNGFDTAGLLVLISSLRDNKGLQVLSLGKNILTSDVSVLGSLGEALAHNRVLVSLDLNGMDITDKGIAELTQKFGFNNKSLRRLYLSENPKITDASTNNLKYLSKRGIIIDLRATSVSELRKKEITNARK